MKPLPWGLFDVFALGLPRGHGFGDRPPLEIWQSDDGDAFGVIRQHATTGELSLLVARRRVDRVWTVTFDAAGFLDRAEARTRLEIELKEGAAAEPLPPSVPRRAALHDLGERTPSETFKLLTAKSHRNACWLLNQLYLALPRPDRNWASDCQSGNLHTRLWEAQLLACFREQGLKVTQPYESPDFRLENRQGDVAWVEAVTANPPVPYEHLNAEPTSQPETREELFFGAAALRFAKTIGSKLQRPYVELEHVRGKPFAIAIADFQAGGSMVWSREALTAYLTGYGAEIAEVDGKRVAVGIEGDALAGGSAFRAGLFRDDHHAELSAIIFSNACSLGKFNRMAISSGAPDHGLRYVRYGKFADRTDGALEGIPFCLDVASEEYRALWAYGHETWCAELEIFHNPFAHHPIPDELLPEATHWRLIGGEWRCRSHYPASILWSRTLILKKTAPIPTYETMPQFLDLLAAHRASTSSSDSPIDN